MHTAVLPAEWRDRVVYWSSPSTDGASAAFLDPYDCVVSKLVAHRDKDLEFAAALIRAGLIDLGTLRHRIDALPADLDPRVPALIHDWLATWQPPDTARPS